MDLDPKHFAECSDCGRTTYLYDSKITHGFYGRGLCWACEVKVIASGFWTQEKILEFLNYEDKTLTENRCAGH